MFADNMNIYASRDCAEEACKAVSVTLRELTAILSSRGLAMNAHKTVGMLILPRLLRHQANTFGIFCHGAPISMGSRSRLLGGTVNNALSSSALLTLFPKKPVKIGGLKR